jgi:hypothetical protein
MDQLEDRALSATTAALVTLFTFYGDWIDNMAREDLTPFEQMLYDDDYTSSTDVYDERCYICRDPDFARMGLPLCRSCPRCKERSGGRELGHIAADDTVCTVCGYDEYEDYMRESAPTYEEKMDEYDSK